VHGQSYVLHLTSSGGHSFAAKEFFAAAAMPAADRAKVKDGKIELDSETAVDLHFTAPKAGSYEDQMHSPAPCELRDDGEFRGLVTANEPPAMRRGPFEAHSIIGQPIAPTSGSITPS
jgi:hypothetical protein